MRLRQIALVARDLEQVVDALCATFDLEVCFHDPGVGVFGLRNALMVVGDDAFLEVVSPVREGTAAGRHLVRRGGDGGYMVIVQSADLAADRARVAACGVRIVWEATLDDAATIHLHPRDLGGAILSIDAMVPPGSWRWAGPTWRRHVRTGLVRGLLGATLATADAAATAARWAAVLGRNAREGRHGTWEIVLDPGTLRFVAPADERGEGLVAVQLAVTDPEGVRARARARGLETTADAVLLGGTRWELFG